MDHTNFLESLNALLDQHGIQCCLVGGQAVNACVGPLVSLDLDIVVAADFVQQAQPRDVLGMALPVAGLEYVLHAKVWAAQDPERRGGKRQKDLADIVRLIEAYPHPRDQAPEEILSRLYSLWSTTRS